MGVVTGRGDGSGRRTVTDRAWAFAAKTWKDASRADVFCLTLTEFSQLVTLFPAEFLDQKRMEGSGAPFPAVF
jgi:hypothetical protein